MNNHNDVVKSRLLKRVMVLSVVLLGLFLMGQWQLNTTLAREIQPFPSESYVDTSGEVARNFAKGTDGLQQFEITKSTVLTIRLPIDAITHFKSQNGITTLVNDNFAMILEDQVIHFEFEENQLTVRIILPRTFASIRLDRKVVLFTNADGEPLDSVHVGDVVYVTATEGAYFFETPGIHLTGSFSISVIDPLTGNNVPLSETGGILSGKIVVEPLSGDGKAFKAEVRY